MQLNIDSLTCTDSNYDPYEALISSLLPEIEKQAQNLARRVYSVLIEADDLIQEALTAIWNAMNSFDPEKCTSERARHGFYMKRARGAMLDYIRTQFKKPALSLEAWQELDSEDGTLRRELADQAAPARTPSYAFRRRLLAALRHLPEKDRTVIMAAFLIDDNRGRCLTPEDVKQRLQLTTSAFYHARKRALKYLAMTL